MVRTVARTVSSQRLFSTAEEKKPPTQNGHGVPAGKAQPPMSAEDEKIVADFRLHQSTAAKLSMADEVRTLIEQSIGYGVISTNSRGYDGYPTGSVVGFALNDDGSPFFVFSTMSAHTTDLLKDGRASLTVMANDFKGAAEGRVVLIADVVKVFDADEREKLRTKYLARHPGAYWADFGDFSYFKMKDVQTVRFVGGFAMAGSVTGEQYANAVADPIAPFAQPIMKHMNDDHGENTASMVKHYVGIDCTEPMIVSIDSLGMMIKAKLEVAGGGYSKIRLPFPRPALTREDIKTVLVEMTNASPPLAKKEI
eukprot:CAMPEP_0119042160 /NCGR_PEP_ID=MMETSP1177-20130426/14415_1 /TAXON_ID=2985 /ORGANISM="Ochromonas sp, Strain CCMP1899" /LENGTH=309 /DNA_ID=CAMNT_0007008759 /DNA_START=152 /DNA_END=1081 /DNA_ORIENTATION=-